MLSLPRRLVSADSETTGSRPCDPHDLAGAAEAIGLADLGQQVGGEDGADAEDRAQRLQAQVAARTLAQLGIDDRELLVEHRDQREHGLDIRERRRRQRERAGPPLAGDAEQAAAAARPALVREQRV